MNWIPVSQLPYTTGEVLVTLALGHNVHLVDIVTYDKKRNTFTWYKPYRRDVTEKVLAWMPVPKPYEK